MTQVLNVRILRWFLGAGTSLLALWAVDLSFLDDDWGHVLLASRGVGFILSTGWEGLVGQGGYYRPVVVLSLYLDYLVGGYTPVVYHLTNVLIHTCCALMVVRLGRRLDLSDHIAWAAGVLFLVLPIHTDTVFWVVGRTDSLCALFYLGALSLFLGYVNRPNQRTLIGFYSCCALAFLSKEMALSLPGALLVLAVFRGVLRERSARIALAGMVGVFVAYLAVRLMILDGVFRGTPGHFDLMRWTVDLVKAVAKFGMTDWKWFGGAVLGVTLVGFVIDRKIRVKWHSNPILLLFALTAIGLVPALGHLHNWYLYLPSAFFCLGVAHIWLGTERRIFQFCFVALVLYYGVVMSREGGVWRAASALSEQVIAQALPHAHATDGRLFVMHTPSAWTPEGSLSGKPLFAFALKNALAMRAKKPFVADVVTVNRVWLMDEPFRYRLLADAGRFDVTIEAGGFFSFHGPGAGQTFPFELENSWGTVRAISSNRMSVALDLQVGDRVIVFDGRDFEQVFP